MGVFGNTFGSTLVRQGAGLKAFRTDYLNAGLTSGELDMVLIHLAANVFKLIPFVVIDIRGNDQRTSDSDTALLTLTNADHQVWEDVYNLTPTDISLSVTSIAENNTIGDVIGVLSTTDPDSGNTFTYTLESGTGSTDNASFTILGANLKAGIAFDYETKSSYSIRVRSTDQGGLYFEKVFTISITNITELSSELLVNGVFDANTDWQLVPGWSISNGLATHDGRTGYNSIYPNIPILIIGRTYEITFSVVNYVSGSVKVLCGSATQGTNRSANGTYTQILTCAGSTAFLISSYNTSFNGSVDNVSVKEVLT